MIGVQADMWDPAIVGNPESYDHFAPILQELASQAESFGGPLLLLNGDSHVFADDRPLADPSRPQNLSIYGLDEEVSPASSHPFAYRRMEFANQPGFDPSVCPGH